MNLCVLTFEKLSSSEKEDFVEYKIYFLSPHSYLSKDKTKKAKWKLDLNSTKMYSPMSCFVFKTGMFSYVAYLSLSFIPCVSPLPLIFSPFSSLSPYAAFVLPISPQHTIDTWGLLLCCLKSSKGNEES